MKCRDCGAEATEKIITRHCDRPLSGDSLDHYCKECCDKRHAAILSENRRIELNFPLRKVYAREADK